MNEPHDEAQAHETSHASRHARGRIAEAWPVKQTAIVWGAWAVMVAVAAGDVLWINGRGRPAHDAANIALLALAAAALMIAVARVRGRPRIADAFFPLVLLNPLLYRHGAAAPELLDKVLLTTGLLGLMTGAIIAMQRRSLLRYFAVAILTFLLTLANNDFLLTVPALVVWFIVSGYTLARAENPAQRVRGFVIMSLGEVGLLLFGLACITEPPAPTPPPEKLFSAIVGFIDFPILVLAIMMLALGSRKGPEKSTPPHFAGMLALLVGLLMMLLNNFERGALPQPRADQTVLLLCLLYTVFALHGPRRLQWVVPPTLLIAAALYTVFR